MNATINFLGAQLDSTKEYELHKNDSLGFNITVEYTDDNWRTKRGVQKETFNNCTEFHWRFNETEDVNVKESAFESDIHSTGCTRKVLDIKSVLVEYPTKKHDSY